MVNIKNIKNRIPLLDLKKQYRILTDNSNDKYVRLMIIVTFVFSILYFVFPFDIIPDIILGLGYFDDLTLYMILREVAYTSSDKDLTIKESLVEVSKSKLFLLIGLIIVVLILFLIALFYGTNI